jgi:hypothetical protein
MGGYANETSGAARRHRRSRRLAGLVLVLGTVLTIPALADPPAGSPGNAGRDRPVSTRPIGRDRPDAGDLARRHVAALDRPPLTRAAAQRRVEQMSPTAWLSRYGDVTIGVRPH